MGKSDSDSSSSSGDDKKERKEKKQDKGEKKHKDKGEKKHEDKGEKKHEDKGEKKHEEAAHAHASAAPAPVAAAPSHSAPVAAVSVSVPSVPVVAAVSVAAPTAHVTVAAAAPAVVVAAVPAPIVASGPAAAAVAAAAATPATVHTTSADDADADRLHAAMAGVGTDEAVLIEVIGSRNKPQAVALAVAYQRLYGHSLVADLKSETSFHFKALLTSLVTPVGELLADLAWDAIAGAGTKDMQLIDVMCTLSPIEHAALIEAWNKKHTETLPHAISGDTSFNYRKTLLAAAEGKRQPPGVVDQDLAARDVETLFTAGEKSLGTDEQAFIGIISARSAEHLQYVSMLYSKRHGHSLETAIQKETSGHFCTSLVALCTPRHEYIARRIHDAVAGAGTNDDLLVRMLAANDRAVLRQAAGFYKAIYGKDMAQMISEDLSGDYRKLAARLFV